VIRNDESLTYFVCHCLFVKNCAKSKVKNIAYEISVLVCATTHEEAMSKAKLYCTDAEYNKACNMLPGLENEMKFLGVRTCMEIFPGSDEGQALSDEAELVYYELGFSSFADVFKYVCNKRVSFTLFPPGSPCES
jgi:hypothetical protein